jgi:hypothetical protein
VNTLMIVSTVVWAALGLLSFAPVMMSPMMFDAPGSYENKTLRRLVASLVSFPVACVVGIAAGWMLYAWVDERAGIAVISLPLVSILALAYYVRKFTRETKQAKPVADSDGS